MAYCCPLLLLSFKKTSACVLCTHESCQSNLVTVGCTLHTSWMQQPMQSACAIFKTAIVLQIASRLSLQFQVMHKSITDLCQMPQCPQECTMMIICQPALLSPQCTESTKNGQKIRSRMFWIQSGHAFLPTSTRLSSPYSEGLDLIPLRWLSPVAFSLHPISRQREVQIEAQLERYLSRKAVSQGL